MHYVTDRNHAHVRFELNPLAEVVSEQRASDQSDAGTSPYDANACRSALKEELAQISQELPARRRLYEAQRAHYEELAKKMEPLAQQARDQLAQMNRI